MNLEAVLNLRSDPTSEAVWGTEWPLRLEQMGIWQLHGKGREVNYSE